MAVLITSDLHLSSKPLDEYRHLFMVQTLPNLIETSNVKCLIILGDLTHEKNNHDASLVNRICRHVHMLSKICRVIILKGNHDYIDPDCPFFEFLKFMPNVQWINKPLKSGNVIDGFCTFLPHTHDANVKWDAKLFTDSEIVFAHQMFTGAVSETGQALTGIPIDAIPRGLPVVSGDVHVPQRLKNITYVGAPYTVRFGDAFDPRVLLLDDNKLTSIPCLGPRKRLIKANSIKSAKQQIQEHPNDIIKVRIAWEENAIDKWSGARRELIDWASENGLVLHGVEALIEGASSIKTKKKYQAASDKSDKEVIGAYCKTNGVRPVLEGVGQKIASER